MTLYDMYSNLSDLFSNISLLNRAIFALLTALFIMLYAGNPYIRLIKYSKQMIQPIRDDGPQTHLVKQGTPTLGGLLIMFAFILSSMLWVANFNAIISVVLITSILFALIGLIDDVLKLFFKNTKGLAGRLRLLLEGIISLGAIYILEQNTPSSLMSSTFFPFVKAISIYLGIFIYIFSAFVIVGSANGLNLTDGLDGLASYVSLAILIGLASLLMIILMPNMYLDLTQFVDYNANLGELMVVIFALIGAILGFLWFNSYPAKIFMGDVGSLGIGSAIGIIVVSLRHEFFLAIIGMILIIESLSVIIQVYYYKATKKRIFLMAPIHHHYEKKGYRETTIVNRMFIITISLVLIAISLLDF